MKSRITVLAVGAVFAAAAVPAMAQGLAQDRGSYYSNDNRDNYRARDDRYREGDRRADTARVIDSRPVYATERREECWNPRAGHFEEVRGPEKTRIGKGAAIGAVAGGVVGNQVGDHSTGGTVAGALIGGLLGHQIQRRSDNNDEQDDLDRSRCRVIAGDNSGDVQGYDVRYEYRGNEYVARMANDPGRRLRLGEDINHDGTPFNATSHDGRVTSWR
jgi:uncharacterized protein YcfJ